MSCDQGCVPQQGNNALPLLQQQILPDQNCEKCHGCGMKTKKDGTTKKCNCVKKKEKEFKKQTKGDSKDDKKDGDKDKKEKKKDKKDKKDKKEKKDKDKKKATTKYCS